MELTKEVYTTREAAKILNKNLPLIGDAIRRGLLKADKFGPHYAITKKNLQEYIEYRKARGLS